MLDYYKTNFLKDGSRASRQMTMNKFVEMLEMNIKWKSIMSKHYKPRDKKGGHRLEWVRMKNEDYSDESDEDLY